MALSNDPVFPQTPKTAGIAFGAASQSTVMDPSTAAPTVIVAAGADGAVVTHLVYASEVTSAAEKIVLWIQSGGTGNWYILEEKAQAVYVHATTTAQAVIKFVDKEKPNQAIRLAASDKLGISHHVDQRAMALAEYTDF